MPKGNNSEESPNKDCNLEAIPGSFTGKQFLEAFLGSISALCFPACWKNHGKKGRKEGKKKERMDESSSTGMLSLSRITASVSFLYLESHHR
jgi:hypothetical protein